ncbi:hypothetical protein I4I73_17950 [Pseudonocardia sp. KRD-184]|uniref:Uncharacterized protein n=1 Tax=Pseudonocardia oceani TaxID=2792013 RepID=A0ABS6U447_9PSEU|nr:hypothetical protein [Pseudonocardia oceani]MBW0093151.1 hypothetical protein [Pseudonocardia oceani]MBW0097864.1 hypothetical protein [Pseudonocardia oceani]MBW0124924.1 hypothetical protein [Pseudonocardia oceani]MBW0127015.1 hypothetical protein [Pseudonocardia oceani]
MTSRIGGTISICPTWSSATHPTSPASDDHRPEVLGEPQRDESDHPQRDAQQHDRPRPEPVRQAPAEEEQPLLAERAQPQHEPDRPRREVQLASAR